jgi:hypothetical protein
MFVWFQDPLRQRRCLGGPLLGGCMVARSSELFTVAFCALARAAAVSGGGVITYLDTAERTLAALHWFSSILCSRQ